MTREQRSMNLDFIQIAANRSCCAWQNDIGGDAFLGFGHVDGRWIKAPPSPTPSNCLERCRNSSICMFASYDERYRICIRCRACQLRAIPDRNFTSWAKQSNAPSSYSRISSFASSVLPEVLLQKEYSLRLYGTEGAVPPVGKLRVIWTSLLPAEAMDNLARHGICTGYGALPECPFFASIGAGRAPDPSAAVWLHLPTVIEHPPVPSHGWAEVTHCPITGPTGSDQGWKLGPMWLYVAPGSGVSINVGRTHVVRSYGEAVPLLALAHPGRFPGCNNASGRGLSRRTLHRGVNVSLLDSIQIVNHKEYFSQEPKHELVMLHLSECSILRAHTPGLQCGRWPMLTPCSPDSEALRLVTDCGSVPRQSPAGQLRARAKLCVSSSCYADGDDLLCPQNFSSWTLGREGNYNLCRRVKP